MKVEILEWNGISTWNWNFIEYGNNNKSAYIDELCGICRVAFEGTCPDCKFPGDDCPIVLGYDCTHNFHLHCILKWLEQNTSKGLCPMCRQVFTFNKSFPINSEELVMLQNLIDSHKLMRERITENSEEDFEVYEEQAYLQNSE